MATSWKDKIPLKLVNIIAYLLFLGSNIYTVASPDSVYFNRKETYLTPALWAFLIWPVIYFLFLGTVIYQFFPTGKKVIIDSISWRFPLLGILSAIYINLWATHHYIVAVMFILFVVLFVAHINNIVKKHHISESWGDRIFIHLPFSLYCGWATVLLLITGFEAFGVDRHHQHAGIWTKIFVFIFLSSLQSMTAMYAFSTTEGGLPASMAIVWSLWALFAHQTSSVFVHWSSLVFAVLALICVVNGALIFLRGRIAVGDEERAPLLR